MNPIAIDFGIFTITWYAIFIVTGMLVGLNIAVREGKKHKISKELLYDYAFYAILFGFLGARTWYVLFDLQIYLNDPSEILKIWHGGLAIHGGLLGAGIYTAYFCHKNKMNVFKISDIAIPGLLFAQSLGRFGNFMNSEAHGPQTTQAFLSNTLHLPDFIVNGMYIDGIYYHPTFLYESVWNFVGMIIVLVLLRPKWRYQYGKITAFYLIWYGFIRTFIEQMRTDALMFGPIRIAQLTSIIMVIVGIMLLIKLRKDNK